MTENKTPPTEEQPAATNPAVRRPYAQPNLVELSKARALSLLDAAEDQAKPPGPEPTEPSGQ